MASIRNPLAGFGITIFGALGLSFLAGLMFYLIWGLTYGSWNLFQPEGAEVLIYFYLPFALFGVGMFSGRSGFLGSLGFIGATLGGFVGIHTFQLLFVAQGWPMWPADLTILMNFAFGALCGAGGLVMGKLGLRRVEKMTEHSPKMRRCSKCGAKVGIAARKCWSCRGYLPPI